MCVLLPIDAGADKAAVFNASENRCDMQAKPAPRHKAELLLVPQASLGHEKKSFSSIAVIDLGARPLFDTRLAF